MTDYTRIDAAAAHRKYKQQMSCAKRRGIDWLISLDEWIGIWAASGKWELRGKGSGKYVMGRRGDAGPYSADNCFILAFEENIRQGGGRPAGRGWTIDRGKFQVQVRNVYVGRFSTQEEAEAAYAAARNR